MSRTNPDPVFAAAAQAALEERVGSRRRTATTTRRPWMVEFGAIAGVVALVAGIAVGVNALRPSLDTGGAPVDSVSTTSPHPTPDPSATSSATPLATPLATPTGSAAPPASETPAPSDTPLAPPTPTTPPMTAPPTSAPPTPATPSTAPPSSALIGPTGARTRSSAEVRTWALSLGFGEIWAEQAVLDTSCMAEHGFRYDPEFARSAGVAAQHAGLTGAQYAAFQVALWGPQSDAAYDWRTAGCHGRSVHETGQDDAN